MNCYAQFTPTQTIGQPSDLKFSRKETESQKPLKYLTTNYWTDKDIYQSRNITGFVDGTIPPCKIDSDTALKFSRMSRDRCRQELRSLPLSLGNASSQGPVLWEDQLRPRIEVKHKTCLPTDTSYYNRSFQIFDYLPIKPNQNVNNYVQQDASYRQGIPTRKQNYYEYKYGSGNKCS